MKFSYSLLSLAAYSHHAAAAAAARRGEVGRALAGRQFPASNVTASRPQAAVTQSPGENPNQSSPAVEEGDALRSSSASSDEMMLQFFGDPGHGGVTTVTFSTIEVVVTPTETDQTTPSTMNAAVPPGTISGMPPSQITDKLPTITAPPKTKPTLTRMSLPKWNGTVPSSFNESQPFTRFTVTQTEGDPTATLNEGPGEPEATSESPYCLPDSPNGDSTTFSIVYTETTTFYGDPASYTPPYPPLITPEPCTGPQAEAGKSRQSFQFTVVCSTLKGVESCTSEPVNDPTMAPEPAPSTQPMIAKPGKTVTFMTTDKNPSVVFSPVSTPDYGHDGEPPREGRPGRTSVVTNGPFPNSRVTALPQSMKQLPTPTFVVTAGPTLVAINDRTITDLAPGKTTVVTVSGEEFTINPSQVIGGGSTIDRPAPPGAVFVPGSTTTLGGVQVIVAPSGAPSVAVIDGTTVPIGPSPSTTVIRGQTMTVGPSGIIFSSQTVPVAGTVQTEVVVAGGDMITAIGQSVVVIRSTTFTYGPGISARTEIIDDDTIIINPSGVVVHSTTLGGPKAGASDVAIEIVGGATITQIGQSMVVIGSSTYTVGPGTGRTTTVIGGETVTIGPNGISVSTLNLPFPFGPTVVTTIKPKPTATATVDTPAQTSSKNGAIKSGLGWDVRLSMGICIAIGVWVFGNLI